ncbi:MAG TPA: hypothetical protein VH351_00500 [Bryobacteraceae bacterium]|jgi:hypothetical protein|nr:hypothetical protein [Bryobacteraceae bacterium]
MKHIGTMALILAFGVAGLYAHERPVKTTFSELRDAAGSIYRSRIHIPAKKKPPNSISLGTGRWAHSPSLMLRQTEISRSSPALARQIRFTFKPSPAQVYFASRTEVY